MEYSVLLWPYLCITTENENSIGTKKFLLKKKIKNCQAKAETHTPAGNCINEDEGN